MSCPMGESAFADCSLAAAARCVSADITNLERIRQPGSTCALARNAHPNTGARLRGHSPEKPVCEPLQLGRHPVVHEVVSPDLPVRLVASPGARPEICCP